MNRSISDFTDSFPAFVTMTGAALGLWIAACAIYLMLSPAQRKGMVNRTSIAARLSLGGTILSFALPIAASLIVRPELTDFLLWSGVLVLLCLFVFSLLDAVIGPLSRIIQQDRVGSAGLLAASKLSISLILVAGLFTS